MFHVSARRVLRQQIYKTSLNITQSIFCVILGKHMADAQKGRFVWVYFCC